MPAVRCLDVCKTYRQGELEVKGLDHVTLDIDHGDFVCLSAPSGGGKTTLLNAIGGLHRIDSGEIWIADQRIDTLGKAEMAGMRLHKIGFVFQAYNLIPVLTARENVEFVMEVQGVPGDQRHARSTEILAEVGLAGLEDRRPAKMSGGQQQRVAVARAIASRPALVLADEPTANLDSHTAEQLMELFVELNTRRQTTFVIATHDQRVMKYARRIVRMLDGRIVDDSVKEAAGVGTLRSSAAHRSHSEELHPGSVPRSVIPRSSIREGRRGIRQRNPEDGGSLVATSGWSSSG